MQKILTTLWLHLLPQLNVPAALLFCPLLQALATYSMTDTKLSTQYLGTLKTTVEQVLQLFLHFYVMSNEHKIDERAVEKPKLMVRREEFESKKIANKLSQQINESLSLACSALPSWCEDLNYGTPMLFDFDTRMQYLTTTAFGPVRSLVWLQAKREGGSGKLHDHLLLSYSVTTISAK